jgi:uncharacterized protein with NRDE domain
MCTVLYIPIQKGKYLFAQTRDEGYEREKAIPPQIKEVGKNTIISPIDPVGGGSWIGTSKDRQIVIMNGARIPHKRKEFYDVSRGKLVSKYFLSRNIHHFIQKTSFALFEAFTLIIYEGAELYRLFWDEKSLEMEMLNSCKPYIFSSSTLYSKEMIEVREQWFKSFIGRFKFPNIEDVELFLKTPQGSNPDNFFIMDRKDLVKTVNMSIVDIEGEKVSFIYEELDENTRFKVVL